MDPQALGDNIIAGIVAGISKISTGALQAPFKRAMIILQTQGMIPNIETPYRGVLNCVRILYREEGFKSLWRGMLPEFLSVIPKGIAPFIVNSLFHKLFNELDAKKESSTFFLSNLMKGVVTSGSMLLFSFPFDVLRIRLGTDMGRERKDRQFKGMIDCSKKIYQKDGFRGFYKGFNASLIGIGLYRALYFGLFDIARSSFDKNTTMIQKYFVAQGITLLAGGITYPLETIRKRLSMQAGRPTLMYTGIVDCVNKMIKTEGTRSLFRGFPFQIGLSIFTSLGLLVYSELAPQI